MISLEPQNFGSKAFEDNNLKTEIEKKIRSGQKLSKIKKSFKVDNIDEVVEQIKDELEVNEFWYYDENNKIKLSPLQI